MGLIIHNIKDESILKDNWEYGYTFDYEEELDDEEINDITDCNISEVWYWYASGSWEGAGWLLGKHFDKNLYVLHCMNHCSCYERLDKFSVKETDFMSLDELEKRCTHDLQEEAKPLLKLAREKYK